MVVSTGRRHIVNFRSTLIIIILLVGLGITYFLFLHNSEQSSTEINKPRISEIYNLQPNEIQKIHIQYDNTDLQNIVIIKDPFSNWKITSPFITNADTKKINELISEFVNKQIKEKLEVTEYKKYGLEKPTIQIKLWTSQNGQPKTFSLGKKAINYSVYTKEATEDHIFLIESSALQDLSKSPNDIRDKSVLNFNPNSITQLHFVKPDEFICQKLDGIWKIIQPLNLDADSDLIDSMLTELHALKVSTFEVDGDIGTTLLDKYGMLNPITKLKVNRNDDSINLDIGSRVINSDPQTNNEEEYVYVRSSNIGGIYTVSNQIIKILNKTLLDIRDKRVIDFQREDTIKFEIELEQQKTTVIKLDDTWELQTSQKILADPQAVSDLLFGVDSLKAVSFITNPNDRLSIYGLNPPKMLLKFTIKGEDKPAILKVGKNATEDTVYVISEKTGEIATVKRGLIDKLYQSENWLSNKQVFHFKIDDPIRIFVKYQEVSTESNTRSFTLQLIEGNWRLTSPIKENANNEEIKAFLYRLIDLRIDEFLSKDSKKKYSITDNITGLNSPYIQIIIELQDEIYNLQIGNQDSKNRYYCRLKKHSGRIFLIDSDVISNLMIKLSWIRNQ
ncbi:hypothetical protein C6497_02390 [Candidatus Poribacteria bacterium]|nr:MAG: hypothetical protein C6497_02390 [Candidatus Poribacteria bacterium]